jgi:hypothetical protein
MNLSHRILFSCVAAPSLLIAGAAEASVTVVIGGGTPSSLFVTEQGQWSVVEDPPHDGMSVVGGISLPTGAGAALVASGAIPSGTDIGYASVNAADIASATEGFYFDPASDFEIAVDFSLRLFGSTGGGAIGFGIGEDVDGVNSLGVGIGFFDSTPLLYSAASRVNDVDQALVPFIAAPTIAAAIVNGRFFVEYQSATQEVILGVSPTPDADVPDETVTLSGIVSQWEGDPLLVSFFLRSQSVSILPALTSGQAEVIFSNFEVLSGAPITIVPEPAASLLAILGALGVLAVKKRTC